MKRTTVAVGTVLGMVILTPTVAMLGQTLPRVFPYSQSGGLETSPVSKLGPVGVGSQGATVFLGDPDEGQLITVVDSTSSRVLVRLGRPGAGPGEVRAPMRVSVRPDIVTAYDVGLSRYTMWGIDGKVRRSWTVNRALIPMVDIPEGFLAVSADSGSFAVFRVTTGSQDTASARVLLTGKDRFMADGFSRTNPRQAVLAPVLGTWSSGFIVGNPNSGDLGFFTWAGALVRQIGGPKIRPVMGQGRVREALETAVGFRERGGKSLTASERDGLETQIRNAELPYFSAVSPIGTDRTGRHWVFGVAGDSAFADVFSATRYIGRIGLPCSGFEGRASVNNGWIAMLCSPRTEADEGANVKVFRILG
jgi:hypothetical protein